MADVGQMRDGAFRAHVIEDVVRSGWKSVSEYRRIGQFALSIRADRLAQFSSASAAARSP